jgi:hypothetical protein
MEVLIVILAKDKERELPLFFECLEKQDYDTKLMHLYIRSNDNRDNTIDIIEQWLEENESKYASCFKDYSDIDKGLKQFGAHEWNPMRFSILGKIRQDSIQYAMDKGLNYLVIDCDNFIKDFVIRTLADCNLPVVAPFLKVAPQYRKAGREHSPTYSNYHFECDANGYFYDSYNRYNDVYHRVFKGFINCKVVHCTYYIKNEYLKHVQYLDETKRYEYVIFSDSLRKANVPQYLYNELCGGLLVLLEEKEKMLVTYKNVMNAD